MSIKVFDSFDFNYYDGECNIDIKLFSEFKKHYKVERKLGNGAFAEVYLIREISTNNEYVMKIIERLHVKEPKKMWNQIKLQRNITHPNIIKLYKVYADDNRIFFVLEYAKCGDLYEKILKNESFCESDVVKIISSMLNALECIHKKRIIHKDIKPENILFTDDADGSPKLCDFGLSSICKNESLLYNCTGTSAFMAPEVLSNKSYNSGCDMWSIGVITYLLLSGRLPFQGTTPYVLFKKIASGVFEYEREFDIVSEEAKDFISSLLVVDPRKRLSAKKALEHPWLQNTNTEPLSQQRIDILSFLEDRRKTKMLTRVTHVTLAIEKLKLYKRKTIKRPGEKKLFED